MPGTPWCVARGSQVSRRGAIAFAMASFIAPEESAAQVSRLPLDRQLSYGAPSVAVSGVVSLTEGVSVENAQRR